MMGEEIVCSMLPSEKKYVLEKWVGLKGLNVLIREAITHENRHHNPENVMIKEEHRAQFINILC